MSERRAPITFEEIPALARPIAEKIVEVRPDIITACDTGARLAAFAVSQFLREMNPHGSRINFLPISSKGLALRHMAACAFELLQRQMPPADVEPADVFIIDDVVASGHTLQTARAALSWAFPERQLGFYHGALVDAPNTRETDVELHAVGMQTDAETTEELMQLVSMWTIYDNDRKAGAQNEAVRGVVREPLRPQTTVVKGSIVHQARAIIASETRRLLSE